MFKPCEFSFPEELMLMCLLSCAVLKIGTPEKLT